MTERPKPAPKAPGMERMLQRVFGRTTAITNGKCARCKKSATSFTDTMSEREYTLSGLCQECQDQFFEE